MGDVLPLRDTFISIFFASLGMLFNPQVVWDSPALVGLLVCGFVLGKGFLATLAAQSMRFPARVALLAGAGLGQFGELGFVLAGRAVESNVIDESTLAPVLAAGIISMFLTPVMIRLAPHFTAGERMLAPLERLIGVRSLSADEATSIESLKGHVVLIGFGVAGQLTARALAASNIPYMILDLNADNVRKARAQGEPIFYGDATSAETLGHAHLDTAAALVVLINDPSAVQRVLDTARRVVPQMPILLRTHYLGEKEKLLSMGATDVVAEEIEGGIEILSRLLRWFSVPRNVITDRLELIRQETQTTQRQLQLPPSPLVGHEELADLEIDKILVKVGCLAEGRTTAELQLRQNTSALVVAVRRAGTLLEYPDPNENFQAGDIVYLVGSHDAIIRAERFFV
jgi:CPA2 family monovalent cation:H+ antiporter-2